MYFNENRENTNIDDQFNNKEKFEFKEFVDKNKKKLLIFGAIFFLIITIIGVILLIKNRTSYSLTLEGGEEITIYKDSNYNDPGYYGFDDKNNDLTSEIVVEGTVNSSEIGTYTITYKLKKITKTRTIKVVAKPTKETIIYLNNSSNTGSTLVRLKAGETYREPGYSAIDAIDGDLTNKVKITGKVNTNKKGTYKIVYSVENSTGVTTSETRIVIVE